MDRRQNQTWLGLRPTPSVLALMIALGIGFLVDLGLGHPPFIREHLMLHPLRGLGREPWQLLTNAAFHAQAGALLSTLISLWFFGSPTELQIGRTRLWQIVVGSTVAGSIAAAGLARLIAPGAILSGAGPAGMAMIAAFGVAYSGMPLSLFGVQQMKASTMALVFLGISALMHLFNGDWLGLAGGLTGAGVGALIARVSSGAKAQASGPSWAQRFKKWRIRRRYKVLTGGRDTRSFLN